MISFIQLTRLVVCMGNDKRAIVFI